MILSHERNANILNTCWMESASTKNKIILIICSEVKVTT